MPIVVKKMPDGPRQKANNYQPFMDGQVWKFSPNEISSMTKGKGEQFLRVMLAQASKVRRLKGSTRLVDGHLYFQATAVD